MKITHRLSLVAALGAFLIAPGAFAESKVASHSAMRFWNFPDRATSSSAARSARLTHFTPNGGDLGNFVLKLSSAHRPVGFNANSFAYGFGQRDFEGASISSMPLFAGTTSDSAMVTTDSMFRGTNDASFGAFSRTIGNTPEPSTIFGAGLAFAAILWTQRRRLLALVS